MRILPPFGFLLGSLVLAGCATVQRSTPDGLDVTSFDDAAADTSPSWRQGTTNPRAGHPDATWRIVEDAGAPSAPNALALTDAGGNQGQTFHLCWDDGVALADLDLAVRVRADEGTEDRGGGPAWRIQDASNYYVARWNPLEDNFRVYSVVDGERLQLASARVRAAPNAWHSIRVRQRGDQITCWFDGEPLLEATDTKLPGPGGVGVWTKADAETSFDDFGHAAASE